MKKTVSLALLLSIASAMAGYWFGFSEGIVFGVTAESLPRGSIAVAHLKAIRAGNTQHIVTYLESEVDSGLIWGFELFNHPLRHVVGPLWGFDYYPAVEQSAVRLANYRKTHPSSLKPDMFDQVPPGKEHYREHYRESAAGIRKSIEKLNVMVERYASR